MWCEVLSFKVVINRASEAFGSSDRLLFGFARSWILNARVALSHFSFYHFFHLRTAADANPIDSHPRLFVCGAKHCPLRSRKLVQVKHLALEIDCSILKSDTVAVAIL